MSDWTKSNQGVEFGNIFVSSGGSLFDECGHYDRLYQVTGKRGKTLVTLRQIDAEPYIDETCDQARGVVKLRPVPDSFISEGFDVRARVCVEGDSSSAVGEVALDEILRGVENRNRWGRTYHPYGKWGATRSGWYGFDIWERYKAGLPLEKASGSILREVLP